MEEALVSVIVPVYNVERYLHKCIQSIVNQSYKNLEIILVDDGSTDMSRGICQSFAQKDKRIFIECKKNGGLSSARNYGLEKAKGEYVCFIDGDDYVHPDMIKILYKEICNSGEDFVYCQYQKVNENEEYYFEELAQQYTTVVQSKKEAFHVLLSEELEIKLAWNKLYKKSLFNDVKYKEGYLHEDEYIIHHLLNKVEKIKKINLKLYYYIQREGSIMSSLSIKRMTDTIEAYEDRIKLIKNEPELSEFLYMSMLTLLSLCKTLYIKMKNGMNQEDTEIANKILKSTFKKWYECIPTKYKRMSDKLFKASPIVFFIVYDTFIKKD